jgi:1-phosphofructokinase family hexose kinase
VLFTEHFELGKTIRATHETRTPSGKGIGSSLVLQELDGDTVALGFNGGLAGKMLTAMLDAAEIQHHLVEVDGETRIGTLIVDSYTQQQSTVTAPTLVASSAHIATLLAAMTEYAGKTWGIICAGSLPMGVPIESYAAILDAAQKMGLVTLLDASGKALQEGIRGLPSILKVNENEMQSLKPHVTLSVTTPDTTRHSLLQLNELIGECASQAIIVTMGRDGTIAVTPHGGYYLPALEVDVVSTAGAGDAFSAGMMLSLSGGDTWKQALQWGTAAAASVVMNAGTAICKQEQVKSLLSDVVCQQINFA